MKEVSVINTPMYLGVALLFSWIYLLFYASSAGIESAAPISLMSESYTISAATMVVTLLLIAYAFKDQVAILTSRFIKVFVAIFMPIGSLLLIVSSFNQIQIIVILGSICTGITSGFLAQQWVLVYRKVGLKSMICMFPSLMALSVGVCMTLMYLPRIIMFASIVMLPVISEVMFHRLRKETVSDYQLDAEVDNKRIYYILLMLPVCIFGVASGFLDYFSDGSIYTYIYYGLSALFPICAAGAFILVYCRNDAMLSLYIPLAFLVAILVPIFSLASYEPMKQFISIGELGIEVVLFVALVAFADFFTLKSLATYAIGRATFVVITSLGWYLAQFTTLYFDQVGNALASFVVIFFSIEILSIILIVAFVKAGKGMDVTVAADCSKDLSIDNIGIVQVSVGCEGSQQAKNIDNFDKATDSINACSLIAKQYQLSKRETDVLVLLSKGYSSTKIQSELYISAGTVNYHTRNIYTKLDVHSKQEVIGMVEAAGVV